MLDNKRKYDLAVLLCQDPNATGEDLEKCERIQREALPPSDPPGVMMRRMWPWQPEDTTGDVLRAYGPAWELYAQLYHPANYFAMTHAAECVLYPAAP